METKLALDQAGRVFWTITKGVTTCYRGYFEYEYRCALRFDLPFGVPCAQQDYKSTAQRSDVIVS